eukprot:6027446-Pyramimonas_sp.AAC.1
MPWLSPARKDQLQGLRAEALRPHRGRPFVSEERVRPEVCDAHRVLHAVSERERHHHPQAGWASGRVRSPQERSRETSKRPNILRSPDHQ